MRTVETLCLNCLSEKGSGDYCYRCGFDEAKSKNAPVALPLRTLLNERFVIGRILGQPGGFGITYLAWDRLLETPVAIKEFMPLSNVSRSPGASTVQPNSDNDEVYFNKGLNIFLNEAKTLAQFSHPNIIRIKDFFKANNTAYLIMEYYQGMSLSEFIKKHGGVLTEAQALSIMLPILEGLQAVHQYHFLHRDIKPGNIYITDKGMPLLLDFGAARLSMLDMTHTLTVMLSRGFAPFEQYHQKGNQGPWTDIYACAATLYYMTTGKIPPDAIERRHQDQLITPTRLNPSLSAAFSLAVMKAMAVDFNNRPQSITQFKQLLTQSADSVKTVANTAALTMENPTATTQLSTTSEKPRQELRLNRPSPYRRQQEDASSISLGKLLLIILFTVFGLFYWLKERQTSAVIESTPSTTALTSTPITDANSNAEGEPQQDAVDAMPESPQTESVAEDRDTASANVPEQSQELPQPESEQPQPDIRKAKTAAHEKQHPPQIPSPDLSHAEPIPVSAIKDCESKAVNANCRFETPKGIEAGRCLPVLPQTLSCIPDDAPRPPGYK